MYNIKLVLYLVFSIKYANHGTYPTGKAMLTIQLHGFKKGNGLQQLLEQISKAIDTISEDTDVRTEIFNSHCQLRGIRLTTPQYILILGSEKTETLEFILKLQEIGIAVEVSYIILSGNLYAYEMH